MRTRARGAVTLMVAIIACAAVGCGSPGPTSDSYLSSDVLEEYRGENDLVTLLPAGALTSQPDVYETAWGRAFLDEVGHEVAELDLAAFGALLAASGETPMWQAYYACLAADRPSRARDALDSTGITQDAVAEAEAMLLTAANSPGPADARALDAIAAIGVLGCLENGDLGDRVEPVRQLVESTDDARLALEVQLHDALEASASQGLVSSAPVPVALTRECAGVDAYAAAAAIELGRANFDDVSACLTPYATYLADTQVLYRLAAAGGPEAWREALIDANMADIASRVQEDGIVAGRSHDFGSASSTLTALRLLRLAGDPAAPVPSWVGDGLAAELHRVMGTSDTLEVDLVRHACVLAEAACAEPAALAKEVSEALEAPADASGSRAVYARMAYELGLDVDLHGEVDATTAMVDRELLCVAAAFELADPGSTGVERSDEAWDVMVDHLEAADVVGASCASWLWRVGNGGHGEDTDQELRRAVEGTFRMGDDGLWRSDLSPAGDLALSLYLYEVIGLA